MNDNMDNKKVYCPRCDHEMQGLVLTYDDEKYITSFELFCKNCELEVSDDVIIQAWIREYKQESQTVSSSGNTESSNLIGLK